MLKGQASATHELDEVIRHAFIVLIDSMHNGVYKDLLVGLTQFCHVAEINICNATVRHGKDVAWMWVTMEKPKLQQR